MKTSKIITLLLIMLIFSFIYDAENKISKLLSHWSNQIELKTDFNLNFPTTDIGKVSIITLFLK